MIDNLKLINLKYSEILRKKKRELIRSMEVGKEKMLSNTSHGLMNTCNIGKLVILIFRQSKYEDGCDDEDLEDIRNEKKDGAQVKYHNSSRISIFGRYMKFICDFEPDINLSVTTIMNLSRIKGFVRFHKLANYTPATCRNQCKLFNELCKWLIGQPDTEMQGHITQCNIIER